MDGDQSPAHASPHSAPEDSGAADALPVDPIKALEKRLQDVEDRLEKDPKDFWDKLSAISGILAGVIVAGIGFYATQVYDRRSREVERADRERSIVAAELLTVEKFFPHLQSSVETERQGAIEAIKSLGNEKLATDMARIFGGAGARQALINIAPNVQGESRVAVEKALTDLFAEFGNSILRVYRNDTFVGTAFFITEQGLALTAKHVVQADAGGGELYLAARDGVRYPAKLMQSAGDLDLALLSSAPGREVTPLRLLSSDFLPGEKVSAMGYRPDTPLSVSTGTLSSVEPGRLRLDLSAAPGMSGSPILNSRGEVIGVLSGSDAQGSILAIPVRAATALLADVGVALSTK